MYYTNVCIAMSMCIECIVDSAKYQGEYCAIMRQHADRALWLIRLRIYYELGIGLAGCNASDPAGSE